MRNDKKGKGKVRDNKRRAVRFTVIPVLVVLFIFFAFAPAASAAVHALVNISTDAGVEHGASTTVPIIADDGGSNMCLGVSTINVSFDPSVVIVTNVATGSGNALAVVASNIQDGWVKIASVDGSAAHNGTVTLANVTYEAVSYPPDTSPLNITVVTLAEYEYLDIPYTVNNGTFTVTGVAPIELFNETGSLIGGFGKIQDAVNNASTGYKILVHDGTYSENVDVDQVNLTLQSENGFASTTVQALNPSDHVFNVTANSVNISGFTVTGATGSGKAGIYIANGINYCNITNNTVKSNDYGFYLLDADNNNITCNWVHHNVKRGFYVTGGSTGNNISCNNIVANGEDQTGGVYHYQFANNQTNDIVIMDNWWGTIDNDTINASIWDWQDDGNWGTVTFRPKLSGADPCAPIPEMGTIALFGMGLLMLAGFVFVERKRREE